MRERSDGSWRWILVPLSIIGIIVIAAVFVSRRPASNSSPAVATATVAEATPPAVPQTAAPSPLGVQPGQPLPAMNGGPMMPPPAGTALQPTQTVPPPGLPPGQVPATQTTAPPQPAATATQPRATTTTQPVEKPPAHTTTQPPATSTHDRPAETAPPTQTSTTSTAPADQRPAISEAQARSRLWPVVDANYDTVESDCLKIESLGYSDGAYNFLVSDSCANNTLGRWRVDAKTREVSQQ